MTQGMESAKDYYELLGVGRDATHKEIQQAYYRLARAYHPDGQATGIADPEEEVSRTRIFKAVSVAYHILSDDALRKEYDKTIPPDFDQLRKNKSKASAFGVFGKYFRRTVENDETSGSAVVAEYSLFDLFSELKSIIRRTFSRFF